MKMEILDLRAPLKNDAAAAALRITEDEAARQIELIQPLLRPRALLDEAFIQEKEKDSVLIGGVRFHSRVLAENLRNVEKAFPFILTIGDQLEKRASEAGDILDQYRLETLGDLALGAAGRELEIFLKRYGMEKTASMSPGSLDDWPITEQPFLFSLLEDGLPIDVRLTDSMLMIPRKSLSGFYFPTEIDFQSCRLCPRENCGGRRASYDPHLKARFFPGKPGPE